MKNDGVRLNAVKLIAVPWLRWEAVIFLAVLAGAYGWSGSSWWWFAGLFLAPDLFMVGYLRNARVGAWLYNTGHTYVTPLVLAAIMAELGHKLPSPLWLIWLAHIAFDRMLGFGLKDESGFTMTHLGIASPNRITAPEIAR